MMAFLNSGFWIQPDFGFWILDSSRPHPKEIFQAQNFRRCLPQLTNGFKPKNTGDRLLYIDFDQTCPTLAEGVLGSTIYNRLSRSPGFTFLIINPDFPQILHRLSTGLVNLFHRLAKVFHRIKRRYKDFPTFLGFFG